MNSLDDQPRKRRDPRRSLPASAPDATLKDLYARYGSTVYRRARALLGDPDRAQDATQEVFLRAIRAPAEVAAYPFPWLYRVTTNLCLNNLRDGRRRGKILATWQLEAGADDGMDDRVTVNELLAQVPEDLKEIAIHYYVGDLSRGDIAAKFGVSLRTIGNRLAAFRVLTEELRAREGTA
jgi:RNA polymerase sigma-70 factor (ECF subfamily)